MLLALYLFYFSFYTANGNGCWDKFGIYMHTIVALLVFFVLPLTIIGIVLNVTISKIDNPGTHTPMHVIIIICKLGDLIAGATQVRLIVISTWKWRKHHNNEPIHALEGGMGIAFTDIVHGWGEGEPSLGKPLEMNESLNSYLFVSLIREEYYNHYETGEKENEAVEKETNIEVVSQRAGLLA